MKEFLLGEQTESVPATARQMTATTRMRVAAWTRSYTGCRRGGTSRRARPSRRCSACASWRRTRSRCLRTAGSELGASPPPPRGQEPGARGSAWAAGLRSQQPNCGRRSSTSMRSTFFLGAAPAHTHSSAAAATAARKAAPISCSGEGWALALGWAGTPLLARLNAAKGARRAPAQRHWACHYWRLWRR